MTHLRILPYKMGSESARNISRELGILQVHPDPQRSKYNPNKQWFSRRAGRVLRRRESTIINWGCSVIPEHLRENVRWINHPDNVARSVCKLRTLQTLTDHGVPCPEYTLDPGKVDSWLRDEQATVFARTLLNAHSGRGIIVLDPDGTYAPGNQNEHGMGIPYAPLYTKYIKSSHEYRGHMLPNGKVHLVQKRRSNAVPDDRVDWRIRNHGNGFIFAAEMSFKPEDIEDLMYQAKDALGLDFFSADIVYNEHQNKSYIIEVNTASGAVGRTLDIYVQAFKERLAI